MYYKTVPYRIFYAFNLAFVGGLALLCVLPVINELAISLSSRHAVNSNLVSLWPVEFTLDAYRKTFDNENFLRAFMVSVLRTALGAGLSMMFTVVTAYPLSKSDAFLKGRTVYTWIFVFTMLFSGGLIPHYILMQKLGLMNTIWALVLPPVNAFNIALMLNFFRGIPKELEEAALMDGAGHFKILAKIYIPLSLPSIATLSLFVIVTHWNSWFEGFIYMSDSSKWPLATLLQTIVVNMDFSKLALNPDEMKDLSDRTVKAAQIFISLLPIIAVYPFLQKYFVKGIILGSVKE